MSNGIDYPYRLVDQEWRGWLHIGGGIYKSDESDGWLHPIAYEELLKIHSPLRPVLPVTDEDRAELEGVLQSAKRKAAATLLVGMYRAAAALREPAAARDELRAGRSGSWEAASFESLAWNLGSDLAERPERFDHDGAGTLARMLERWATDPARYTEVAENIAWIFGRHAEAAGGWAAVSDRWMQPGAVGGIGADRLEGLVGYLLSKTHGASGAVLDALG